MLCLCVHDYFASGICMHLRCVVHVYMPWRRHSPTGLLSTTIWLHISTGLLLILHFTALLLCAVCTVWHYCGGCCGVFIFLSICHMVVLYWNEAIVFRYQSHKWHIWRYVGDEFFVIFHKYLVILKTMQSWLMYGSFRMPIEPGEEYAVFQIVIDLSHLFVICGMVKFQ